MKIILALAGAAAFGAAAPAANAIEFLGGTIQTSHLNYTQFSQAGRNAIQGAFQVGITPKFSVQADVNFYDYKAIDQSGNNVTLHGIYNLGHQTSVGAFVGQDSALSTSIHFYGVEGGTTFHGLGLEGFVATGSKSGIDGTLYGVSGHYTVLNKLGLGLSAQRAEFTGSVNLTRVAATADYAITDSLKLYAEYGRLSAHGFGGGIGENYVGFGARFSFGPQNGVSFGKRGLLDFLPGF